MTFLGKAIGMINRWRSYHAHIIACALMVLAPALNLNAQQPGQSVAGDCTVALNNVKDVHIGNIIVTCIGEAALTHLAEAIANKRPDLLSTDDKEKLKLLRSALGLTEGALEGFFRILGEEDIPPGKLAQRLTQIAEHYRKLREQIRTLDPDDPGLKALRDQALAAIEAGRLNDAKDLLTRIIQARKPGIAMAQKLLIETAEAAAALGRVAVLQRRYPDAAAHFRTAGDLLPRSETARGRDYREAEADAFDRQSDEGGDNEAATRAIALYRVLLQETPPERVPLAWAATQNMLGNTLRVLGERESGTARLEEAVAAYRTALLELTRERAPLAWAMTQNSLGATLTRLGERESGTARLEEAVATYRDALQERTRERTPLDWATTQNNLGSALQTLGEREGGTARLEEAVAAYRDALQERTRERVPIDWAATQNNLGNALARLGERESGTARLEEALVAYRAALEVFEAAQASHYAAASQRSLARALGTVAERTTGASNRPSLQPMPRSDRR